jgi:hypothetical protein
MSERSERIIGAVHYSPRRGEVLIARVEDPPMSTMRPPCAKLL